jgi:hypothetical protein
MNPGTPITYCLHSIHALTRTSRLPSELQNRIFKPIAEDEMLDLRARRGPNERLQTTENRM